MADGNYEEALARARELANRFSNMNSNSSSGIKRPADESVGSPQSVGKRVNVSDAVAAASEAAARINQKLGSSANEMCNPFGGPYNIGQQVHTIIHKVPDNYVGLIIGKKGENITNIQKETGCKVQIAPESGGLSERNVTMIGSTEQIEEVKKIFNDIIERAQRGVSSSVGTGLGHVTIDISIPGSKAGLIIGKNGDTIKQLQEQTGAKMVLIQDSNAPTMQDKPLRISGDAERVEKAKQMVLDLLNSRGTFGATSLPAGATTTTYAVPSEKAGLVIGKGGETIREVIKESGAHVEIQKQPPPNPAIKVFNITGTQAQIEFATRLICEKAGITSPQGGGNYASNSYSSPGGWNQSCYAGGTSGGQWGQNAASAASMSGMPPPTVNPATGQLDYSAAWAYYYRSKGMHDAADKIMSQAAQNQALGTTSTNGQANATNMVAQSAASYDYSQWQQYSQQYQQWQQQTGQQPAPPGQNPSVAAPGYPTTNQSWNQR